MTEIVLCRVDGCTRASVAQRGPWKGWCVEHKHLRGKQVETPMNPPAPRPSPAGPPQRLQELVTTIAARREELLELQAEALALLDEIREVVAA